MSIRAGSMSGPPSRLSRLHSLTRKVTHPGEFLGSVRTLMTGTVFSQFLLIAISPILTRLYSPEDYGKLGVFVALATIIGVFSTLRYHYAIVIADDEQEARTLFQLCFILIFITAVLVLLGTLTYHIAMTYLGLRTRLGWLIFLLPISVLFTGLAGAWGSWCNRRKYYRVIARGSMSQSLTSSGVNTAVGLIHPSATGLVIGTLASQLANCVTLGSGLRNPNRSIQATLAHPMMSTRSALYHAAYKFRRFPQYDVLADLSNVASTQLPLILLAAAFSDTMAGFLVLAQRVVGLPMTFVGSALGQVFYQRAAELRNNTEQLSSMLLKIYRTTLFAGVIPTMVLVFFGDILFAYIFGEDWRFAGVVCQFVAPAFLFQFVSSPLSSIFWVDSKQKQFSIFCTVLFLGRAGSIIIPVMCGAPFFVVAFCYGMVGLALWLGFALLVLSQRCPHLLGILLETLVVVAVAGSIGLFARSLVAQHYII